MIFVTFHRWREEKTVTINPLEVSHIESGSDPYYTNITMKNGVVFGVHSKTRDVIDTIHTALEDFDVAAVRNSYPIW